MNGLSAGYRLAISYLLSSRYRLPFRHYLFSIYFIISISSRASVNGLSIPYNLTTANFRVSRINRII